MRVEAVGELLPGEPATRLVIGGAPGQLPEVAAPRQLVGREFGLVRVDMHLVGKDTDAQFLAAIGLREEARFQAHWQECERHVGRQERHSEFGRNGLRREAQHFDGQGQ